MPEVLLGGQCQTGLDPQKKLKNMVSNVRTVSSAYGSRVESPHSDLSSQRYWDGDLGLVIYKASFFFSICINRNNNSYLRGFSQGENNEIQVENLVHSKHSMNTGMKEQTNTVPQKSSLGSSKGKMKGAEDL